MKHFVTAFLFCFAIVVAADLASAQSSSGVPLVVAPQKTTNSYPASLGKKPHLQPQGKVGALTFADTAANGIGYFYLPYVQDSAGVDHVPHPYLAYLGFAERFTLAAKSKWYIDSAEIVFATSSFDSVNPKDRITLRVLHGDYFVSQAGSPFNGVPFPFSMKKQIDSAQVDPALIPVAADGATTFPFNSYSLNFHHKLLTEPMFYLELTLGDTSKNHIAAMADNLSDDTHPAFDTSRDRSYWIGAKPWDKLQIYANLFAGSWYSVNQANTTDTLWKYPNFVMTAFISDTSSAGVAKSITSTGYELGQNYPNPFNPTTDIVYTIPRTGQASIVVSNSIGQEMFTAFSGVQSAGEHRVTVDASSLPSGTYFYTLKSGTTTLTRRMVLAK